MEELDLTQATGIKRDQIAYLGSLDVITGKENVILLGPLGTGKPNLATALPVKADQPGRRVQFTTADLVTRLPDAHQAGRFPDEINRLGRCPLLVIDESGYLSIDPEAANVFFQRISARYERATSPPTNPSAARAKSSATKPSPPP